MARQMTTRNWITLILLSVIWGSAFLGSEIVLEEMSPIAMVTWRIGIAAAILSIIVARGLGYPREAYFWRKVSILGFLNPALPFALISYAQTKITGSLAAILSSTVPLWVVIIAPIILNDESISTRRLSGVVLGVIGVAIMAGRGALDGFDEAVLPQIAVLLATLSYALSTLFTQKWLNNYSGRMVAGGSLIFSFIYVFFYALVAQVELFSPSWHARTFVWVFVLGAFSTALAYLIFYTLLKEAGSSNATLVGLLIPCSASILCYLVLGQKLTPAQLIGMIFILVALLVIDNRLPKTVLRQ